MTIYTPGQIEREKFFIAWLLLVLGTCAGPALLDAKNCNADMAPSLAGSPVTSDDEVTTLLFHETRGMEMKNYRLSRL